MQGADLPDGPSRRSKGHAFSLLVLAAVSTGQRIGRNNIQQEYSARFRDDDHIKMLFRKTPSEEKPEVINMNLLFNSRKVVWDSLSNRYTYLEEELEEDVCEEVEEVF